MFELVYAWVRRTFLGGRYITDLARVWAHDRPLELFMVGMVIGGLLVQVLTGRELAIAVGVGLIFLLAAHFWWGKPYHH